MKALENRGVALLAALLIVFGSTVWNVNRNLGRRADEADEAWFERYGAEEQLRDRSSYASQLWSLCQAQPELGEESHALRKAYNELYDALEEGDRAAAMEANRALSEAADAAYRAYSRSAAGDNDRSAADRYFNYMTNAQRMLRDGRYNELAEEYALVRDNGYLNALSPLIFVDEPVGVAE